MSSDCSSVCVPTITTPRRWPRKPDDAEHLRVQPRAILVRVARMMQDDRQPLCLNRSQSSIAFATVDLIQRTALPD